MEEVYWAVDGLLAGRTGPWLAPWDLTELRESGLQVIVSLTEEVDALEIAEAGFRHYLFAIPPLLVLTDSDRENLLQAVTAALPIIRGEVVVGRPVLVHCYAGKDRTGVMLAAYLMQYQGLTAGEAIERLRGLRPDVMSAPGYEEAARQFGRRANSILGETM